MSEQVQALVQNTREIMASLFPPNVRSAAAEGKEDTLTDLWRRAAEFGLFGLRVPEQVGGLGLGWPVALAAVTEFGRALFPGPWADQLGYLPALIDTAPVPAGADLLARLASGQLVAARPARLTYVSAFQGPSGTWRVSGEWLQPYAGAGVSALVPLPERGIALLVDLSTVDGSRPSVALDPLAPARWVVVQDLAVPPEAVLLLPEGARAAAETAAALVTGALLTGMAETLLDLTVAYITQRVQFGRPLGSFQAVKHKAADMYIQVELMRSMLEAAADGDPGDAERVELVRSIDRSFPGRCRAVAEAAVHLHGAMGYSWETGLHFFLRTAKAHELRVV